MTWTAKDIRSIPETGLFAALPDNLKTIVKQAIQMINPDMVWIFGSRARGDAKETSDFDIAFKFSSAASLNWTLFWNQVTDNPPSLHKYDLVDFNCAGQELKERILKEGFVIYVRK